MRKVFLDDSPRWGKGGKGKEGTINWKECTGILIPFIYDNIEGELEILECSGSDILVKYKDIELKIKTGSLLKCQLGRAMHYAGDITIGGQKAIEFYNDIPTTHPWMVKYFQGGYEEAKKYTYQSNKKVSMVCPNCGRISSKEIPIYNLYNQGLSCVCSDGFSFGHKFIHNMLSQLGELFDSNVRFDWCVFEDYNGKKRFGEYDFVLREQKIIIEVDGDFHRINNIMSGQTKEHSKYIDEIKNKLANENGYDVIRIEYYDEKKENFKYNIKGSKLSDIFDLENVIWQDCYEFAMSNISKIIADYWNNRKEGETTMDLGKKFGICSDTIRQYLKGWAEVGYCNYDSEIEKKNKYLKASISNVERCSRKVEVFKDNLSVGVYKSISELERVSVEKLSCQLQHANICKVLKGIRPHHKGFTFKYVD